MDSSIIFGERVKSLRTSAGLTLQQLGDIIGVTKQAINDIEKGRRTTTFSNLVALAEHFEVSVDYLLGLTNDPVVYRGRELPYEGEPPFIEWSELVKQDTMDNPNEVVQSAVQIRASREQLQKYIAGLRELGINYEIFGTSMTKND